MIREKHVLCKDGTKLSLKTVCDTPYKFMEHLTRGARRALGIHIRKIFLKIASRIEDVTLETEVCLIIAMSGHIIGGTNIWPGNFDEDTKINRSNPEFQKKNMRVFADYKLGPTKAKRLSVVLVEREERVYWFAHVFLLFHLHVFGAPGSQEGYAMVLLFVVTSLGDEVDTILNCLCLRWATKDEADHDVQLSSTLSDIVDTWEWYWLVPFSFLRSVLQIVRSSYWIGSLSLELPWPAHRFYVNRFY